MSRLLVASRKLVVGTVMASLLITLLTPAVALAGTQGSCSGTDTRKVRLWENVIGDTSDGNDSLWQCGASDPDLGDNSHTLSGNCHSPFIGSGTWEDCVDSVTLYMANNTTFCAYRNPNYEAFEFRVWAWLGDEYVGRRINFPDYSRDQISSWKIVTATPTGWNGCPLNS